MDFLKQFANPAAWWAIVGLVLILAEFVIPGLILFFFGLGALLVALLCLFVKLTLTWQLLFFGISSVVFLLLLRRTLARIFMGKSGQGHSAVDRASEISGQSAVVKTTIDPRRGGKVEFHGTNWTAEAQVEIAEGAVVRIVRQEGLKLIVEPAD